MICLKKAIETGGSSLSNIFELIKEQPQKITANNRKTIER
jgi:hypothetical protein